MNITQAWTAAEKLGGRPELLWEKKEVGSTFKRGLSQQTCYRIIAKLGKPSGRPPNTLPQHWFAVVEVKPAGGAL